MQKAKNFASFDYYNITFCQKIANKKQAVARLLLFPLLTKPVCAGRERDGVRLSLLKSKGI